MKFGAFLAAYISGFKVQSSMNFCLYTAPCLLYFLYVLSHDSSTLYMHVHDVYVTFGGNVHACILYSYVHMYII